MARKEGFLSEVQRALDEGGLIADMVMEGFDLDHWDSSGIREFRNIRFEGVNFTSCSFKGMTMSHVSFSNCFFDGCDWNHVHADGLQLTGCTMRLNMMDECVMDDAVVRNCNINTSHAMSCSLKGSQWLDVEMKVFILQVCDLTGATMEHTNMQNVRFLRTVFHSVKCDTCEFYSSALDEVAGQQLPACKFVRCQFVESLFAQMCLDGVEFHRCVLRHVPFTSSSLVGTVFDQSILPQCDFAGSHLLHTDFRGCDLTTCIMPEELAPDAIVTDPGGTKYDSRGEFT